MPSREEYQSHSITICCYHIAKRALILYNISYPEALVGGLGQYIHFNKRSMNMEKISRALVKLFGGLEMTWKRVVIFAAAAGVYTALMALLVPEIRAII